MTSIFHLPVYVGRIQYILLKFDGCVVLTDTHSDLISKHTKPKHYTVVVH
jgi:hypothetical protein